MLQNMDTVQMKYLFGMHVKFTLMNAKFNELYLISAVF